MSFQGWPEEALDFYEGLEADNSKAYWTAHKAVVLRNAVGDTAKDYPTQVDRKSVV